MKLKLLTVVSTALLSSGSAVYADLVVNGGFETGDFTGWTPTTTTGSAPAVTANTPSQMAEHTGTYGAEFFAGSEADISQLVDVPVAGNYDIALWLRPVGNDDSFVNVILDGTPVQSFDFAFGMPYTQEIIPVVANAGSQSLDIQFNLTSMSGQVYLDDVSMNAAESAVPESSTIIAGASMLLPFGASALRILCKRKMA